MSVVKRVLVVGGGTAGWLTAANLAKALSTKEEGSIRVTLIESPDVPIIGVGEGTWPTMRATLERLGVDEGKFMQACDATFKQGTRFVNWGDTPKDWKDNAYYHLFSSVFDPYDFNLAPYWKLGYAPEGINYAQAVGTQGELCDMGLAPKKITTPAYQGVQSYAYHLNAGNFSEFLRQHAVDNLGVEFISAHVEQVNLDEHGYITSVDTREAGVVEADFYVDCSGFKSMLLGEALGVGFNNINDTLLNDTAVVMQVPYQDENENVRPYTQSTAQEAGWLWDIGLRHRRGLGYVYCSGYTSQDRAEQVLREYAGSEDLPARTIKMSVGYRDKYFHKNCVAIGLSAAFAEPLEASAIFLVEAAANMLCELFPVTRSEMSSVEKKFNDSFHFRWRKTIDFMKLHYMLSRRDDNPYWIDSRNQASASESLLEMMEHWRQHPPSRYDFDNVFEPFVLESYQYVLYGMGFDADYEAKRHCFNRVDEARKKFAQVQQAQDLVRKQDLPIHRELLDKVYQYGFPTL